MGQFKWLEKFSEVMMSIPDEGMRMRFAYALCLYGATGEVVDLGWPLSSLLIACMEDVDYSKAALQQGSRGGRPRRQAPSRDGREACDAPADDAAQVAEDPGNGGSGNSETGVSENRKGGFREIENPPFENQETQSIAKQCIAKQGIEERGSACAPAPEPAPAMRPPTAAEVVAFAKCQTLAAVPDLEGEAAKFVNHYAAQGWVRSNGMAVRDWRPLWAKWVAERPLFVAPRGQPAPERRDEAREHAAALAARYGDEARTEVVA